MSKNSHDSENLCTIYTYVLVPKCSGCHAYTWLRQTIIPTGAQVLKNGKNTTVDIRGNVRFKTSEKFYKLYLF